MWAGGGESAGSHVIYFGQGPSDGTDQTGRNGTKKVWSKTRCITLDWFRHCGIDERNINPEPTKKHERWGNMVSEGNEKKNIFFGENDGEKIDDSGSGEGINFIQLLFCRRSQLSNERFPDALRWHVASVWCEAFSKFDGANFASNWIQGGRTLFDVCEGGNLWVMGKSYFGSKLIGATLFLIDKGFEYLTKNSFFFSFQVIKTSTHI